MLEVEVVESSMVAPCEDTPRYKLLLSRLQHSEYAPLIYYFKPENYGGDVRRFYSPELLKESLSKALVLYYPLAGRVVVGDDGKREIDCTGEGSLFVVARSESTLDELGEVVPSEATRRALIPSPGSGHLPTMFQITFFKCGSVCFGAAMSYAAVDGVASICFINTWGAIARGAAISSLTAPLIDPSLHHRVPNRTRLRDSSPTATRRFTTAVIKLLKSYINKLKHLAGDGTGNRQVSTFLALATHVWRCACRARGISGDVETRMYTPMNFRHRISPPLPTECLVSALSLVSIKANAGELLRHPLGFGADGIRERIEQWQDQRDYAKRKAQLEKNEIFVTSWLSLPVYELDFGYGKPTFMVRASVSYPGTAYLIRDRAGGVTVVACFEPETMPLFKKMIYEDLEGGRGAADAVKKATSKL